MIKSRSILLILLLPIVTFGEKNVDGCLITTGPSIQQRLYWNPYTEGNGSPTEWIAADNAGDFNVVTDKKCFQATGIMCVVYEYGTTGPSPSADHIKYTGHYAVVITECPIDDYVPFVLAGAAGIGVFILRKREFKVVA